MGAELRQIRDDPFEQLLQLESRLRLARLDIVAGQTETWTGLGFRMGDLWFVVPKEEVREVINPPPVTRVPNARPWLTGVANVRGGLLTVLDLHQFLGEPAAQPGRLQRVLVLNSERLPVGFLVDEVAGQRQFVPQEQRREPVPGSEAYGPYLLGAFVREGQTWLVCSLHKITQSDVFKHAGW
jgi:twitching motility protein PilI